MRICDVLGYDGLYQVTDHGDVYSLRKSKRMKPQVDKDGYHVINLINRNGFVKNHKIHRLVAIHFIDNPFGLPIVNHKDGNKINNDFLNLEWVTHLDNVKHAIETKLFDIGGEKNPMNKIKDGTRNEILRMRLSGMKLKDVANMYNISVQHVDKIVRQYGYRIYHHRSGKSIIQSIK